MEQRSARQPHKLEVRGSNPLLATKFNSHLTENGVSVSNEGENIRTIGCLDGLPASRKWDEGAIDIVP